jgi:hypothetical protein
MSDLSMEPWEQGPAECEAEITALRAANTRHVLRIGVLEHVRCTHFDTIANTRPCELKSTKDAEIEQLRAENARLRAKNEKLRSRGEA